MRDTKDLLKDLEKYDGSIREKRELEIKKQNEKRLTKAQKQVIHEAIREEVAEMDKEFGGSYMDASKAYQMATQGY